LNRRIKELREAHIVELAGDGYRLTPSGIKLYEYMQPLSRWAKGWARRLDRSGDA